MGQVVQKDNNDIGKNNSDDLAAELEAAELGVEKESEGVGESEKKFRATEFQLAIEDKWQDKSHAELRREIENQLSQQGLSNAPDEFIDQLIYKVFKDLGKRKRSQRLKSLFKVSVLFCVAVSVAMFMGAMSSMADRYVPREELRAALTNTILKGSNIDDIKLVYEHEVNGNPVDTIWPLLKPYLYYEKSSLSLLRVLNDLKVTKLKANKNLGDQDLEFVSRVNVLVLDHNKFNPFDGLDEQSLRDFRGISLKLDEVEYDKIKDELLNLNSAIKQKNSLISQYLNSSNLSLYVSIVAFAFSVIVTIWQFFPTRKSSQKQLVADALNERMTNKA